VIALKLISPIEVEIDLIIEFSSPVTKPSFEVPEQVRAISAPFHTCWRMQISPGPYIAQVVITALDGQKHEYSWAFMVSDSEFETLFLRNRSAILFDNARAGGF
jgi:hypothetical protein